MNKNYLIIFQIILAISAIYFSSCKPPARTGNEYTFLLNERSALPDSIVIDLYLDGSGSMKGYVLNEFTDYVTYIENIERAVNPKNWKIKYYSFGSNIWEIHRSKFKKFSKASFYQQSVTDIAQVIKNINKKHLSVIVTDLFQNDADIELVNSRVKDLIYDHNLDVGIIGKKSQFDGKIFDVGRNEYSSMYVELVEKDKFRPFYLILIGQYELINSFMQTMENIAGEKFESIIFTPKIAFTNNIVVNGFKSLQNISTLNVNGLENELNFIFINNDVKSVISVTLNVDNEDRVIEFILSKNSFKYEVNLLQLDKKRNFSKKKINSKDLCKISVFKKSKASFNLDFELDPKKLPGEGIYEISFEVKPLRDEFLLPDWIEDWDMTSKLLADWVSNKENNSFPGWTTYNLKNFLKTLWNTFYERYHPTISKLVFYVKKQ